VIGGVWKVLILRELLSGARRYGSLHRTIGGVTHKMLTQQLPPKVEYSLTGLGLDLAPILKSMHSWGSALEPGAAPFPKLAAPVTVAPVKRSQGATGAVR
jgi:DNA-binding HxlR family transcriptional regulator